MAPDVDSIIMAMESMLDVKMMDMDHKIPFMPFNKEVKLQHWTLFL